MGWFSKSKTARVTLPPRMVDAGIRIARADALGTLAGVATAYTTGDDKVYAPLSHAWFLSSLKSLRQHFATLPPYESNAFDCENFAIEFVQFYCRAAGWADVPASPMVARIHAKNVHPFGTIGGSENTAHALNLIQTTAGFFVIEPQTIRRGIVWAPVSEYPNDIYRAFL